MSVWHFTIPFYFGKNRFVAKKGGAPVERKVDYLKQTLVSIKRLPVNSQVTIYVCDQISYDKAMSVHPNVKLLDSHPLHLPLESIKILSADVCFKRSGQRCGGIQRR